MTRRMKLANKNPQLASLEKQARQEGSRIAAAESMQQLESPAGPSDPPACYVTLQQMAAIVQKSKSTIRRLYDKGVLPKPNVHGGSGTSHALVLT